MADWARPFRSSYRFVRVSRTTGYELGQLDYIGEGTLTVNRDTATYESARAETASSADVGSDLVRCYLDASWEDGTTESVCLGTWLLSIPERIVTDSSETCAAYLDGRLVELEEDGFSKGVNLPVGTNMVAYAKGIAEGAGLEVIASPSSATLGAPWAFGLDSDEGEAGSKLDAINELLQMAGFGSATTDPYGRVVMAPNASTSTTEPAWTFEEGPSATFLREAKEERDSRDVCNVVQAVYESEGGTTVGEAVDTDPASPYSTVTLGRRKFKRYVYHGTATQAQANAKAAELLRTQQSTVRRVTLQHVWCGARVGDVVEVRWPSAGISGRYVIRTQDVELGSPGCLTTSELRLFERRSNG